MQLFHVFKFYSTAFRAGKVLKETAVSKMIPRAESLGEKKREREKVRIVDKPTEEIEMSF